MQEITNTGEIVINSDISKLIGKTIRGISMTKDKTELIFHMNDMLKYRMWHSQD